MKKGYSLFRNNSELWCRRLVGIMLKIGEIYYYYNKLTTKLCLYLISCTLTIRLINTLSIISVKYTTPLVNLMINASFHFISYRLLLLLFFFICVGVCEGCMGMLGCVVCVWGEVCVWWVGGGVCVCVCFYR